MPRYLVTGLCMQGNKGGPALALSMVAAIRNHIPEAEFIFSVPAQEEEWQLETAWAEKYGFQVVKRISLRNLMPLLNLLPNRIKPLIAWWRALRSCDALIQMSAICYVGPPAASGSIKSIIGSQRFLDFLMSHLARRSMFAWTQSYGPFATRPVRFFARMDLQRQPIIFCRGDDCLFEVKKLLPKATAKSYPDIAATLAFDKEWGQHFLSRNFSFTHPLVTLSPSAVMYGRSNKENQENPHVRLLLETCMHLIAHGYQILLVPHTLRPNKPSPRVCDFAVAKMVAHIANNSALSLLEEDLSPSEIKSLIANAEFHIGARYHSLVAALSAGVPSISLSWHPKYRDLMRFYGVDGYVVEETGTEDLIPMINQILETKRALKTQLSTTQTAIQDQTDENAYIFCSYLKGAGK